MSAKQLYCISSSLWCGSFLLSKEKSNLNIWRLKMYSFPLTLIDLKFRSACKKKTVLKCKTKYKREIKCYNRFIQICNQYFCFNPEWKQSWQSQPPIRWWKMGHTSTKTTSHTQVIWLFVCAVCVWCSFFIALYFVVFPEYTEQRSSSSKMN